MFKSIEINNYQSHKHTILNLHEGVNIVVGSSASGKTTIFRAIGWIKNNRPLSIRQFSRWIKEEGKLKGETSAILTTKDEHKIKRVRNKDENYYQIDDLDHFDAPKAQVPEEITKLLNLTEVNVQNQMDPPFLVSYTGPEVSRFLNNVIRMDIIDSTLSNAEKRKRQYKKKIEELNIQLIDTQTDIDTYKWLDGPVGDLILRLEVIAAKKEEINALAQDIETGIHNIKEWEAALPKISDWDRVQEIINSLQINIEKKERINEEGTLLRRQIEDHKEQKERMPSWDISLAQEIINEIDKISRQKIEARREEDALSDQIIFIKDQQIEIENHKEKIRNLQHLLPDICPLCGSPIDEHRRSKI